MAEISYVNTVNVTITNTPIGLSDFVVANIGLFTNEQANFSDDYKVYVSSSEVEKDFGTESLTFKMANSIFAQTPNLRSGKGALIIAPYIATNGNCGYATTVDLTNNLKSLQAVTNGELNLIVNGKAIKFTNIDLSSVKSIKDVVTVLNSYNKDVSIEVTEDNEILFTSKQAGKDSKIAFTQSLKLDGITDLYGETYLALSQAVISDGSDAVETETFESAVNRISKKIFFGGVLDTCIKSNEQILANATAIESLSKKIYVEVTPSLANIEVLGADIKAGGYKNTRLVAYSKGGYTEAKCMEAAYLSRALCTNYSGSNTCITMNLKELATIIPDDNCSDDTLVKARANGVDIYGVTGGLGCVYSTKNAGGYMDDQTGKASYVGELEVAAFNYLRQTNTKIPQTESGMLGLKNALAQVCERYVNNGFFGTGSKWNSSEKFGNPEDFERNITELGYYIYSTPIVEQSQSEREDRIAPLVQIASKSAGALHIVNINGNIEA